MSQNNITEKLTPEQCKNVEDDINSLKEDGLKEAVEENGSQKLPDKNKGKEDVRRG